MENDFFKLSTKEQAALISKAADQLDLPELIIEKDLWICWLLERLFALPIQMAFKGGTSLSKVFGLIQRFSEDCDITIDYRNFKSDLDLEHSNRSQLKKVGDALRGQLKEYVSETILIHIKNELLSTFPEKTFEITLSDDGEQLRFYYPSVIDVPHSYLRDHVFLEFGVRNSTEPCEKYAVVPYLTQLNVENLSLPKAMVLTLSPIRTFWEKATLIHVECHRDRFLQTPERLSRHWYDLFMLANSWVGEQALLSHDILESVVEHKKAFFNSSYANYDDCLAQKLRLIPEKAYLKDLERDFLKMVDSGMFHGKSLRFDEIAEGLRVLELKVNG